jgi:hypothetical protein
MTKPKFGIDKKEGIHEIYIGKWIIIYPQGINGNFTGYCTGIKDGYAILNPFIGAEVKEGKLIRKLIENDGSSIIPIIGSAVEPTTKEYLINYHEMMNKKESEKKDSDKSA